MIPTGALAAAAQQPDDTAPPDGAMTAPSDGAPADDGTGGQEAMTAPDQELFDLVVARTLDTIQKDAESFDQALKADPIKATVEFGTSALHAVVSGADDAGKPVPFPILVQAGMQVIKELGSIANEKGYLPDDQIEVFLKEAFQQSLGKFTQLDTNSGKLKPEDAQAVQQKLGGGAPPPDQGMDPGAGDPSAAPPGGGALSQIGGPQ